ncbi:hypothetical protein StoSoilB3_09980 [Arthrobacter sp. StoSoilB3]|nr:hypothetical protein StoSoilB3_09980 [Arthrobacter sp. StoSoilB3]
MGSIGDVLARRAGSPDAKVLPRRVRHSEKTGSTASLAAALTGSEPGVRPTGGMPFEGRAGAAGLAESLALGAAAVAAVRSLAAEETRLFDFTEAADFAGSVEEISRALEYVQVVAAQAVERTRTEAQRAVPAQQPGQSPASGAQEWRTGWTEPAGKSEAASAVTPVVVRVKQPPEAPSKRMVLVLMVLVMAVFWMMGTGTRRSSSEPGCGSGSAKHGAGSPSPPMSCPGPE